MFGRRDRKIVPREIAPSKIVPQQIPPGFGQGFDQGQSRGQFSAGEIFRGAIFRVPSQGIIILSFKIFTHLLFDVKIYFFYILFFHAFSCFFFTQAVRDRIVFKTLMADTSTLLPAAARTHFYKLQTSSNHLKIPNHILLGMVNIVFGNMNVAVPQ